MGLQINQGRDYPNKDRKDNNLVGFSIVKGEEYHVTNTLFVIVDTSGVLSTEVEIPKDERRKGRPLYVKHVGDNPNATVRIKEKGESGYVSQVPYGHTQILIWTNKDEVEILFEIENIDK